MSLYDKLYFHDEIISRESHIRVRHVCKFFREFKAKEREIGQRVCCVKALVRTKISFKSHAAMFVDL